jgi:hypothetical protein
VIVEKAWEDLKRNSIENVILEKAWEDLLRNSFS